MFQEEGKPGIAYYNSYWGEKVRDNFFIRILFRPNNRYFPIKSLAFPPPPHFAEGSVIIISYPFIFSLPS